MSPVSYCKFQVLDLLNGTYFNTNGLILAAGKPVVPTVHHRVPRASVLDPRGLGKRRNFTSWECRYLTSRDENILSVNPFY